MKSYHYQGKLAVVTGASSGIGEAYARELAARGCHVILVARSKEKLEALAGEIKRKHEEMVARNTLSTPENVVGAGFRGIDKGSSYIIDGRNNYMAALMIRFLPRRRLALINERVSRPKAH
ncbi:putative NAD(P)-dependent oxidoreductase [Paenibacillus sp. 598K]|uniref:SDR family NAD(P)-dependent oxidoreductase n=1 Tax=Paenibacillus sp. 598K TaxID=1117987 RepID=UPI000FFA739B|nr:SDR family NAD(P)-dependent oxidoreductase [Paenibacillus sp. 598K]GBF72370.1 putative NAD(P)-dependent oxidoreductase [Paenibacillus sp. 598K]